MLKRSTSRNQRSRGVRMKHALQIVVLLGICFWLIYQVKYSHDRRRELSGKDAERSDTGQVSDVLKLGRKDLNPRLEETGGKNEKQDEEEEEDEDKHGEGEGEEEREEELSKPEVDQTEDTKKRGEEGDEKQRAVEEEEEIKGDELEDQDKLLDEVDREEDFIDEEKEREEESSEDKETAEDNEGQEDEKQGVVEDENQNVIEDEAHDEVDKSTHEAREEHYKGDDASSAVTHDDNQLIASEMERFNLDFVNESKITTNTSNQFNDGEKKGSESDGKEIELAEKGLHSKETGAEKKDNENGTNAAKIAGKKDNENETADTKVADKKDNQNETNAAKVAEDSPPQNSSVSTENNGANLASTETNTENVSISPSNGTGTGLNLTRVQNSTVDDGGTNSDTVSDGKGADSAIASPDAGTKESSNSTSTDLGLVVSDHKLSSHEKDDEGGNIRLPSTIKENNENDTRNQELEEQQNESAEVKTG